LLSTMATKRKLMATVLATLAGVLNLRKFAKKYPLKLKLF